MVRNRSAFDRSPFRQLAGPLAAALIFGGCSADIARFDSPFLGVNGTSSTNAPPVPVQGLGVGSSRLGEETPAYSRDQGSAPLPPRTDKSSDRGSEKGSVRVAALPDPVTSTIPPALPTSRGAAPARAAVTPPAAPVRQQAPITPGETIEVQAGDTLYGLSRRHHVSVAELTKLNNLSGPIIKPGQKLQLPAKTGAKPQPVRVAAAPSAVPSTPPAAVVAAPVVQPAVASIQQTAADADGTYTVKPGDSLYAISRINKVSVAELKRLNNIADERRVRPGVVLRVRADVDASPPSSAAAPAAAIPTSETTPVRPPLTTQPTIINAARTAPAEAPSSGIAAPASPAVEPPTKPEQVASAATATAAAAPAAKFRWPVKGRVISSFGPRPDGSSNDGIDIAVPMGTDVVAAEAGVVAYAGSELKGFGNLLLVRHDNGWVTAYAHNETLLAKRGDKVRRGQTIAKAGKSGQADQPMVHFEVRQGSKPVDPTPFLEKL